MAFLRVKLNTKNIPGANTRCKGTAVVRYAKNYVLVFRREIVRMQEVKPARRSDILEQALPASGFDVVPSHMRKVCSLGWCRAVEFLDFGINPSEPFPRTLVASFGDHLHAHANPQHRPAFGQHQIV